jgi:hypothetical protein
MNGKPWVELTEEEHQRLPGDYEAQTSQGPITLHSEEHLARSDRGVTLLRRQLQRQLASVAEGANPIGTAFDEADAYVRLEAGNYRVA